MDTAPRPTLPSLQDQLDRITQNTRALVQPERLAISEQATAELLASGIEDRVLRVGALAPEFNLPDALTGKPVRSTDLLALGPLVINFFRGRWCPYCVTELETWRDLHADLRRRGAFFVAISPQTKRQNDFTLQQHSLPFPILSDAGAAVAERFGIAYTVPAAHRRYYQVDPGQYPLHQLGRQLPERDGGELASPTGCGFCHRPGRQDHLRRGLR